MKILVVDDHPENRYFLETLFKGSGTEVICASNGAEALEATARDKFDLIVSDVLMPHMDGFELCRRIKQDPEHKGIPFVFYSATYTDSKDIAFGLSLGALRYLVKPIDPQELYPLLMDCARHPATSEISTLEDEDTSYLKQYNSRLVAKLEKKMLDLEAANRALQEELGTRERLENQLRQTHKMEAVGRLAGGIAHDFNNILGGIVGFAELARFECDKPDAVLAHLDGIVAATNRARDLVQQILTFSRQRERKRRPLRLPEALDDAYKLLRASIPSSIELKKSFAPEVPAILADVTEVHQLATNLVTNAWHAIGTQSNGTITMEVQPLTVDQTTRCDAELSPGKYVEFSVRDTGCGMDKLTLEHIFEPFFSTKAPGKGCGLGLSVVHGIVHACDGTVTVESKPGKGTAFHLYFPAYGLETETREEVESVPKPGHGQRILFVDDDPTLSTLGQRFLSRLGYEVEAETSAIKAIERFREEHFDLVLTDLTMPLVSGLEVARECRALRPETPVILMTGYNPTLQREDLLTQGIIDIILKPYGIQALSDAVTGAFTRNKPATPALKSA